METKGDWLSCVLACAAFFASQSDMHTGKLAEGLICSSQLLAMNDLFSFFSPTAFSHMHTDTYRTRWQPHSDCRS